MKASLKIVGIVVALVLLAGVMAYLAGFFTEKISRDFSGVLPPTDAGEVVVVEVATQPLLEQAAGTLRAKVETVISPIITATISSIAVRAGDEVQAGDELARLDSRELKARVDQAQQAAVAAQARLAQTEKDLARVERIMKADPGAVSKAERDRLQTAMQTSRAELERLKRQKDEAQTALSYSKLTAPIAGRIVERLADPGDTARQGEPLLRMYDPTTLRLEASVRESVASKLAKGQQLWAEIDALKKQYPVVVDEIVPSADPGSRSFLVKVSLSDGAGLYPGMFGRLMIPIGQAEKITIPLDAVTRVGQLDFVTVKTQQGPVRRYVRLGQPSPDKRVEIISGLKAGDKIVITKQN
ncbi:MAG: efflux RND transporter periplasmic adaptor subunit [Deltaproteobacteria bacterium]|nr:efflux RND transporter periplasmic adaptor subunit [Deltaproteobacteria bacterium]MBW2479110.1 efflux RND transporter periplasmic adaptor subunit [Deltaproteobacteria bacterium]